MMKPASVSLTPLIKVTGQMVNIYANAWMALIVGASCGSIPLCVGIWFGRSTLAVAAMLSCLVVPQAFGVSIVFPVAIIFTLSIFWRSDPEGIDIKAQPPATWPFLIRLLIGGVAGLVLGIIVWQVGKPTVSREGAGDFFVMYVAIPVTAMLVFVGMVIGAAVKTEAGGPAVGGNAAPKKPQAKPTSPKRRLIRTGSVLIAVASYVVLLGWNGYFFPVHHVEQADYGVSEEGYHFRRLRFWWPWPSEDDTWIQVGKWTVYQTDGTKFCEGEYNDHGCQIGVWTWYNPDGSIEHSVDYH